MGEILETAYTLVWGVPTLVLILGVGLYLSIRTGFAQLRLFPAACRDFWRRLTNRNSSDGVSPFQALCTALAATVGTGNLAGVAGAIAIGGAGAIFWMWICALLGMVTKLAEATLAVRYRVRQSGEYLGGPMYIISRGMGKRWSWLASLYCFFGVVAAFGVGNATQINAVITGINRCILTFGGTPSLQTDIIIGIALAAVVLILLLGGATRIGRTTELLVPLAAVGYLLLGSLVLILRAEAIPTAFSSIIQGAMTPTAVTGGVVGSFMTTLRTGVSRGVFTNEAGMGTAAIAHGSASVAHPVEQGLMGIVEVFLDTILICTMTALVILCSGVGIPYGSDVGVDLTAGAFSAVLGDWVQVFITAALCLFAFATVLGWGLYGARCAQYLFGKAVWRSFPWLQAIVVILGAVLSTGTVWLLAEIVNGLMAIPNLIALAVLTPELCRLIIDYRRKTGRKAGGGNKCRFPSMQTAVSRPPCANSTPMRWQQRSGERRFTT
ncbi:MAG: sodium:alanine symporter family protein [Oscillospiraceae bacterium]|nr:sodium:alanine symporter family protein [Oscillospiraceae bacterium]